MLQQCVGGTVANWAIQQDKNMSGILSLMELEQLDENYSQSVAD